MKGRFTSISQWESIKQTKLENNNRAMFKGCNIQISELGLIKDTAYEARTSLDDFTEIPERLYIFGETLRQKPGAFQGCRDFIEMSALTVLRERRLNYL